MTTAAQILDHLADREETLAVAESLTGGLLAASVTDVPGASRSFLGGVVSYATDVKVSVLGVSEEIVGEYGVISRECAIAMAEGVRTRLGATWALSTTGVAGPASQEGHPVGTVWIAVAGPAGTHARHVALTGDRTTIRTATCSAALGLLADELRALPREEGALG